MEFVIVDEDIDVESRRYGISFGWDMSEWGHKIFFRKKGIFSQKKYSGNSFNTHQESVLNIFFFNQTNSPRDQPSRDSELTLCKIRGFAQVRGDKVSMYRIFQQ
jgi:hypothetical protein